jgi:hypothetical protein
MPRFASTLALVLTFALIQVSLADAQEVVPPPPPAPPPVYVQPPPPPAPPPPVYALPPAPPPYAYDEQTRRRAHYRMLSRVFTGVGSTMIIVGFFSFVAGIPVLVLTLNHELCTPTAEHSCDGYYAASYALLGGGAALMAGGIALDVVGTVYRWRARFAKIDLMTPRLALLPAAEGGVGGAATTIGIRF